MATTTAKLGLTKPELVDLIENTIAALAVNFQTIDDSLVLLTEIQTMLTDLENNITQYVDGEDTELLNLINSNKTALDSDISSLESSLLNLINNNKTTLDNDIDILETDLRDLINTNKSIADGQISDHLNDLTAHLAERIPYYGLIQGVQNVRDALNVLHERISNIVAQSNIDPNKDVEVIDARHSNFSNTTYDFLDERLDSMEMAGKYFWIETHTVEVGQNTITLTNPYFEGQELIVKDLTYGEEWFLPTHYTLDSQVITFTSPMPETLTFRIINIG